MVKKYRLKRELGLFHVTVAGVGIILGAGIYALIGVAAGETGNTIWLSFLIASIVAGFTGLSYAELSSMFKGDAGEYDYCKDAFGRKIALVVSLLVIFTGIVSAATVSLGFAGYFISIVPASYLVTAVLLIVFMAFLNFYGIKESNKFNIVATTIEFLGLIIIIFLGLKHIGSVNLIEMPSGYSGVFKAGALLFFYFMGFETIVKLREEAKRPERTIPLAIIISIIVTAIVYLLVSISAVSILPAGELASSNSPLADVAAVSFGGIAFIILGIIALFSTSNTVLLTMVTTSRMVYGMSNRSSLPKFLSAVHKTRRTPYLAVFVIGVLTVLFALIGDIALIANLTTVFLFLTFALINLAVILLRYKINSKRHFKMPLNIGKFPVLAALGIVTSLVMLGFSLINVFG